MEVQGSSGRDNFDPKKIYNVSEEEMRAIQERASMREALRKEFQQKASNPYRGVGGYIVSDLHPFHVTETMQNATKGVSRNIAPASNMSFCMEHGVLTMERVNYM